MGKPPWLWLCLSLAAIAVYTLIGPAEKTLGANVRIVYLHGAWVWVALSGFVAAALLGLAGLLTSRRELHGWSRAVGRTGLTFWITYLPLSIWAMQTNWNGLFLLEPRFRLAVVFTLGGVLLQLGVTLLEDPAWASAGNILYALVLFITLSQTQEIMHPASPIFGSGAWRIQLYFIGLLLLTLTTAWQVARLWHQLEHPHPLALHRADVAR
jgi:hypothetical protein